jgi:hypothetical protein
MPLSKNFVNNVDNYNISFQNNTSTIFVKYIQIINEYLKHCLDNIHIQNRNYLIYVINRGLNTINFVFKFILLYTKNLDMVYYNCQKAYIYYVEFIGQISDENHSFLQLNSKDASLFVYKKTIFEINNDVRKDFVSDEISTNLVNDVEQLIKIYNLILYKLIDNNSLIDIIKIVNTDVQNVLQKVLKFSIDNKRKHIDAILTFTIHFKHENIIDHLDIFIKKIKKKSTISINKLEQCLLDDNIEKCISPIKYINSLVNQL